MAIRPPPPAAIAAAAAAATQFNTPRTPEEDAAVQLQQILITDAGVAKKKDDAVTVQLRQQAVATDAVVAQRERNAAIEQRIGRLVAFRTQFLLLAFNARLTAYKRHFQSLLEKRNHTAISASWIGSK